MGNYLGNNIFERLKGSLGYTTGITNSTSSDGGTPEKLTRYIGGHQRNNHPFVTGYWQFFIEPPIKIFNSKASDASNWLHSTAEGFTPPSRTLNKGDVPGQGGLGASFVTGQTLNRTFTVTFREYRNIPILSIAELWCSVIDPYMGVSPLSGYDWLPKSYKGTAIAILTRPVQANASGQASENDIEQVFYFDGVFPEAPPYESFASDISGNDLLQHSITFSFDGWPLTRVDDAAMQKAKEVLNLAEYENTYNSYPQGSGALF